MTALHAQLWPAADDRVHLLLLSLSQAPMVTIADSISAGLKGSMQQARALLKHATEATTAAVQQAGRAASAGGEVQHGAAGKGPSE